MTKVQTSRPSPDSDENGNINENEDEDERDPSGGGEERQPPDKVYQGGDGASTGCFEPPLEEGHCFHLLGWFGLFFVITNVETCGESIHYGLNINKASLFHCKSKR
ncbi:hypothetical protein DY000_02054328 [Brassica cretica]|uniref:Uncharacterized protein n=1 Tax=Brassica cretica TaxID=69181 RepID=A0ABQ7AC09_BRACR|nr:hypothetical protein DY000_02054328 [Brassica cretica]